MPNRIQRAMNRLKIALSGLIAMASAAAALATAPATAPSPTFVFTVGPVLIGDVFDGRPDRWVTELARGGTLDIGKGRMDIDVPAGATVWFKPRLESPVRIEHRTTVISGSGVNDRVSDLNCFWRAREARNPAELLTVQRTGR